MKIEKKIQKLITTYEEFERLTLTEVKRLKSNKEYMKAAILLKELTNLAEEFPSKVKEAFFKGK